MRAFLVLLFALLSTLSTIASAQSVTRAELPQVRKGDAYVYQETDLRSGEKPQRYTVRVVDVTDSNIVTLTGNTRRTYTREWNLIETMRGEVLDRTAEPAWPHYRFPLEVGKRWEVSFVSTYRARNQVTRHEWRSEVEGVENVTVPAGTFAALKLKAESQFSGPREQRLVRGRQTLTYWYAPAVDRFVRMEFQEDARGYLDQRLIELVAVKRAAVAEAAEARLMR